MSTTVLPADNSDRAKDPSSDATQGSALVEDIRVVAQETDLEKYETKVIRQAPEKKKKAYDESNQMVKRAMERWETDLAVLRKEHAEKHDIFGNRKVTTLMPFETEMIKQGQYILQRQAELHRHRDALDELVQDGSIRARPGVDVVIAEEFSDWENFAPFIGKTGTLTRRQFTGMWLARFPGCEEYAFLCGPVLHQLKYKDHGEDEEEEEEEALAARKAEAARREAEEEAERRRKVMEERQSLYRAIQKQVEERRAAVDALQEELRRLTADAETAFKETGENDIYWRRTRVPIQRRIENLTRELEAKRAELKQATETMSKQERQLGETTSALGKSQDQIHLLNQQILQFEALLNPEEALEVSRERAEGILRKMRTQQLLVGPFDALADHAAHSRKLKMVARQVTARWSGKSILEVLARWAEGHRFRRIVKKRVAQAQQRFRHMLMVTALDAWTSLGDAMREQKMGKQLAQSQQRVQQAKQLVEKVEEMKTDFRTQLMDKERALVLLQGRLADKQQELAEANSLVATERRHIEVLRADVRRLHADLTSVRFKLSTTTVSDSKWRQRHKELWKRYVATQEELSRLVSVDEDLSKANTDISEFVAVIAALKGTLQELTLEREQLQTQCASLTAFATSRQRQSTRRKLLLVPFLRKLHRSRWHRLLLHWRAWALRRRHFSTRERTLRRRAARVPKKEVLGAWWHVARRRVMWRVLTRRVDSRVECAAGEGLKELVAGWRRLTVEMLTFEHRGEALVGSRHEFRAKQSAREHLAHWEVYLRRMRRVERGMKEFWAGKWVRLRHLALVLWRWETLKVLRQNHLHVAREAVADSDLLTVQVSALEAELAQSERRRNEAETQLQVLSEKDKSIYQRAHRAEEAEEKLTRKLDAARRLVDELKAQLRSERASDLLAAAPEGEELRVWSSASFEHQRSSVAAPTPPHPSPNVPGSPRPRKRVLLSTGIQTDYLHELEEKPEKRSASTVNYKWMLESTEREVERYRTKVEKLEDQVLEAKQAARAAKGKLDAVRADAEAGWSVAIRLHEGGAGDDVTVAMVQERAQQRAVQQETSTADVEMGEGQGDTPVSEEGEPRAETAVDADGQHTETISQPQGEDTTREETQNPTHSAQAIKADGAAVSPSSSYTVASSGSPMHSPGGGVLSEGSAKTAGGETKVRVTSSGSEESSRRRALVEAVGAGRILNEDDLSWSRRSAGSQRSLRPLALPARPSTALGVMPSPSSTAQGRGTVIVKGGSSRASKMTAAGVWQSGGEEAMVGGRGGAEADVDGWWKASQRAKATQLVAAKRQRRPASSMAPSPWQATEQAAVMGQGAFRVLQGRLNSAKARQGAARGNIPLNLAGAPVTLL